MHRPTTTHWTPVKRVLRYLTRVSFLNVIIIYLFMLIRMLIGQETRMTIICWEHMSFFLENIVYRGRPGSKHEWLAHWLMHNIEQSLQRLWKFFGFPHFFVSLTYQ